jgi:hypothetical protein
MILVLNAKLKSQCVASCSNYVVSSITYTTFPNSGANLVGLFSPNDDDGLTSAIPIGFNFNFYCGTYSQVIIGSNGFLSFDVVNPINPATSQTAQFLPNSGSPNGLVCYNWNDLDPGAGGIVTYTTIGTSPNQQFILTYSNVPIWNTTLLNSGQIILYQTSNVIEVHSGLISTSPYSGTQGIENMTGTSGLAVTGWNQSTWTATNTAYRWSNANIGTPPTTIGGNSVVCFGASANFSCSNMTGANSYSWSLPGGWNGSSTNTALTATAGVAGNVSVTATYSCGTSAPTQFSINVIPAPIVSIISVSPSVLCSGNTVNINASGGINYTLMPGNLPVVPPFTVMPMTNMTYSVYGDNNSGCISVNPGLAPVNVNATPTVVVNSGSVCLGSTFTMTPTGAVSYSFSSLFTSVTPSASGTYSYLVWGIGNNGCVGNAISALTVASLPTIFASASRTTLCIKETTTLTAVGAASYTWTGSAPSPTLLVAPLLPNPSEIYTVRGINAQGCSNTATVVLKINSCTGLVENKPNYGEVKVFPNPFKSQFSVQLQSEINGACFVYDISGALILTKTINANCFEVNLEDFAKGIYYLKITGVNELIKVIKLD